MIDNKLIAEFMGYKLTTDGISDLYYTDNGLKQVEKYNESWDWLMGVIDEMNKKELWQEYHIDWLAACLVSADIESTYKEVVNFINKYNQTEEGVRDGIQ